MESAVYQLASAVVRNESMGDDSVGEVWIEQVEINIMSQGCLLEEVPINFKLKSVYNSKYPNIMKQPVAQGDYTCNHALVYY